MDKQMAQQELLQAAIALQQYLELCFHHDRDCTLCSEVEVIADCLLGIDRNDSSTNCGALAHSVHRLEKAIISVVAAPL
jgi:NAD(P)H-hydrate repair Nnr-like enzyme with NAD(P)H-hydrate epimerase domain